MGETTEHTPVPWAITMDKTIEAVGGSLVAHCCKKSPYSMPNLPDSAECFANVAFIVRACNAHDDLLAACKDLIEVCEHETAKTGQPVGVSHVAYSYAMTNARAAVTKAEPTP